MRVRGSEGGGALAALRELGVEPRRDAAAAAVGAHRDGVDDGVRGERGVGDEAEDVACAVGAGARAGGRARAKAPRVE